LARVSLVGIEILTIESRVVVASVDTFLHYSEEMAKIEAGSDRRDPKVPLKIREILKYTGGLKNGNNGTRCIKSCRGPGQDS